MPSEGREQETIRHLSRLARLDLTEAEAAAFAPQLARILEAFRVLERFPASAVAELDERAERVRADEPRPSTPRERMLAGAPEAEDGFYAVPKTVGGGP